jgi:hypothetical protein
VADVARVRGVLTGGDEDGEVRRLRFPFVALLLMTATIALGCADDASRPLLVTYAGLRAKGPSEINPENARVAELRVRHGCVVAMEKDGAPFPLVAIWPSSAKLTDEGVELDGHLAKFGEPARLNVAIAAGDDTVNAQVKKCGSHAVQYYTAIVSD